MNMFLPRNGNFVCSITHEKNEYLCNRYMYRYCNSFQFQTPADPTPARMEVPVTIMETGRIPATVHGALREGPVKLVSTLMKL